MNLYELLLFDIETAKCLTYVLIKRGKKRKKYEDSGIENDEENLFCSETFVRT